MQERVHDALLNVDPKNIILLEQFWLLQPLTTTVLVGCRSRKRHAKMSASVFSLKIKCVAMGCARFVVRRGRAVLRCVRCVVCTRACGKRRGPSTLSRGQIAQHFGTKSSRDTGTAQLQFISKTSCEVFQRTEAVHHQRKIVEREFLHPIYIRTLTFALTQGQHVHPDFRISHLLAHIA